MREHFRNHIVIWIVNIIGVVLFLATFGVTVRSVAIITFVEIVVVLGVSRKTARRLDDEVIVQDEKFVTIKGIFKNIKIPKDEIDSIKITSDLVSRASDWYLLEITTKSNNLKIYTKEFSLSSSSILFR